MDGKRYTNQQHPSPRHKDGRENKIRHIHKYIYQHHGATAHIRIVLRTNTNAAPLKVRHAVGGRTCDTQPPECSHNTQNTMGTSKRTKSMLTELHIYHSVKLICSIQSFTVPHRNLKSSFSPP
ncbi:hypothetical protein, unlikely [Trypanosoma brucei gambiense DAL972]|uniref:Uncharacterized protein n=1 Tax=Trypanosoma brucei gambiense (strain MHOM/CI/86/DAL972) TaxID=679716 RepID=C9ZL23_TRYB9|nr:hypothetical protein, unlikely [Trypanosoma brucei gambiense DAL972]CBH10032.1 hypothetical protein, unlikely [Trypanosoma brucei gambiense DAL972]|eukprot:XP_011772322.1 hypothetical protein, unlikely [Trypanosoma brucei gambiense DAL972]